MLEVCFSKSLEGALKLAQDCESCIGGATAVILGQTEEKPSLLARLRRRREQKQAQKEAEEREARLQAEAVSLGGSPRDVVCLALNLCEGDISRSLEGDFSSQLNTALAWADYWAKEERESVKASCRRDWQQSREALSRLLESDEPLRLWVDATPEAACGLLHLAALLGETDRELTLLPAPEEEVRPDGVRVQYRGWGEIDYRSLGRYLDRARPLTPEMRRELAARWRQLMAENTPLRVVEEGRIISARPDHYDALLREELARGGDTVGQVLGRLIGSRQLNVSLGLLQSRVEELARRGELRLSGTADEDQCRRRICHS